MASHKSGGSLRSRPSTSKACADKLVDDILKGSTSELREELEESVLCRINSAKGGKVKNSKKGRKSDVINNTEHDAIAEKVSEVLLPVLAKEFERILTCSLKNVLSGVISKVVDHMEEKVREMEKVNLQLRYQLDRQEQYSRRETIRLTGLKEEEEEDTEKKIMQVFQDTGADVKPDDIAVVHRVGKKGAGKNRPVLVKFVSRKCKAAVMRKKSELKKMDKYKGTYMNDDLTILRSRLLKKAKSAQEVDYVTTTPDGRVKCTMKKKTGEMTATTILLENPDDLFKLGFDDIDYEEFGLHHLVVESGRE